MDVFKSDVDSWVGDLLTKMNDGRTSRKNVATIQKRLTSVFINRLCVDKMDPNKLSTNHILSTESGSVVTKTKIVPLGSVMSKMVTNSSFLRNFGARYKFNHGNMLKYFNVVSNCIANFPFASLSDIYLVSYLLGEVDNQGRYGFYEIS